MNQDQEITKSDKSFFRRFWWVIFIVLTSLIIGIIIEKNNKPIEVANTFPNPNAILITANPFDLSQVAYFSKFRSCWGHELPGKNFQGQDEAGSSMRHYVGFLSSLNNTNDKIKLFAPFDGFFFDIVPPRTTFKGNEDASFTVVSPLDPNVGFKISGANMLPGFKKGDKVKAGQLLGYAVVHDSDIDADYQGVDNQPGNERAMVWIFDSMFNHMTPEVLAEYKKYGLTKEKVIIDKEWRDNNSCNFDAQGFLPNKTDEEELADKVYTPQGLSEYQKEQLERQKKKF
jgi:hypothetical protein